MGRKPNRGKFAGLTARTIAEIMGCDESTAKRKLHDEINMPMLIDKSTSILVKYFITLIDLLVY